MSVNANVVKDLREKTGCGMMDCKKALSETNGDMEKAIEYLRKKGLAAAQKKQSRIASEGLVGSYSHNGRIGVMVEVNCETDFVAKNVDFQNFVKEVAMHIAAANPTFIQAEDMNEAYLKKEEEIYTAQLREEGKPENMISKIVSGKISKLSKEVCLLEQGWVKDPNKTIGELMSEITLKTGEKVSVRRFVRYILGEGIEKRQDNLAEEVAKMTGKQ